MRKFRAYGSFESRKPGLPNTSGALDVVAYELPYEVQRHFVKRPKKPWTLWEGRTVPSDQTTNLRNGYTTVIVQPMTLRLAGLKNYLQPSIQMEEVLWYFRWADDPYNRFNTGLNPRTEFALNMGIEMVRSFEGLDEEHITEKFEKGWDQGFQYYYRQPAERLLADEEWYDFQDEIRKAWGGLEIYKLPPQRLGIYQPGHRVRTKDTPQYNLKWIRKWISQEYSG